MVIKVFQRIQIGTLTVEEPALVAALNDGDEPKVEAYIDAADLIPIGATRDEWDWELAPDEPSKKEPTE